MWTSLAPALFNALIIRWLVVPRTMESSTRTIRCPPLTLRGLSLRRTADSRADWVG